MYFFLYRRIQHYYQNENARFFCPFPIHVDAIRTHGPKDFILAKLRLKFTNYLSCLQIFLFGLKRLNSLNDLQFTILTIQVFLIKTRTFSKIEAKLLKLVNYNHYCMLVLVVNLLYDYFVCSFYLMFLFQRFFSHFFYSLNNN